MTKQKAKPLSPGQVLKAIREYKGITQTDITHKGANRNFSNAYICKIESGAQQLRFSDAMEFLKMYSVDPTYFRDCCEGVLSVQDAIELSAVKDELLKISFKQINSDTKGYSLINVNYVNKTPNHQDLVLINWNGEFHAGRYRKVLGSSFFIPFFEHEENPLPEDAIIMGVIKKLAIETRE